MATLYGNQYNNAYVAVPSVKIGPGDVSGDTKKLYFDFTVTAAPTNGDIIKIAKLPKNVRVYDVCMAFPDMGTAGTLELGWSASAELDSTGSAVVAASASGFLSAVDVNTAAAIVNMADVSGAAVAGFLKEFDAAVDVNITVTAAWTVTSGTIKGYIEYVNL